jgi:hypothetical protein
VRAHPDTQWRAYAVSKQKEIAKKINTRLIEEGIVPVQEDVVAWKMHILIRDGLAKRRTEKGKAGK